MGPFSSSYSSTIIYLFDCIDSFFLTYSISRHTQKMILVSVLSREGQRAGCFSFPDLAPMLGGINIMPVCVTLVGLLFRNHWQRAGILKYRAKINILKYIMLTYTTIKDDV